MMLRRTILRLGIAVPLVAATARAGTDDLKVGDNGLHQQPFIEETFFEMAPDLEEAAADGRGLMVLFEQRGCPYCRELHKVNFARPEIVETIEQGWKVVQLDIWGSREATDFDGEAMEERDLAQKWGVVFTPTVLLFPAQNAGAGSLAEAEAFRMPGYFKPFHFLAGLEYAAAAPDQPFQRFLQDRFKEMEERGIEPDVW